MSAGAFKMAGPVGTPLATAEEIIDEARNGRMFILVDDENRENEGDLVIPGQWATPDVINFMATHGRGLICLALSKERVEELELELMSPANGSRHETAFTVSIEAREGVTTGISALDRARTIAAAIDRGRGPEHLVSPGHVFPLVARPGGVLVRAGHTEAAVDISRLGGLNPSGVICEIMNDDGTMARLGDLIPFARKHDLKIGTIRDLIQFRLRHDNNLEKVNEAEFSSEFGGKWRAVSYRNKAVDGEMLALVKGVIDPDSPTLVRMHQHNLLVDSLGADDDRNGLLANSMRIIAEEGRGVVVVINRHMKNKLSRLLNTQAGRLPNDPNELRDYGAGAQILVNLGVQEMVLLTNAHHTLVAAEGYGLTVVGHREIPRQINV